MALPALTKHERKNIKLLTMHSTPMPPMSIPQVQRRAAQRECQRYMQDKKNEKKANKST